MAIDFNEDRLRRTYGDRAVDNDWKAWCKSHLSPNAKHVVDVGCGGGIYARGFASLGARSVTGIDITQRYVEEAREASHEFTNLSFAVGSAESTRLPDNCADIVFHRAVIHHLTETEQRRGAVEMHRILRRAGKCVVQDRTVEDVVMGHPEHWIRSTLFEVFPRLLDIEQGRRPSTEGYFNVLREAGFSDVEVTRLVETRKRYDSFEQLREEILARKGKSILFELSDDELLDYCTALGEKAEHRPTIEADSWTVWIGSKS